MGCDDDIVKCLVFWANFFLALVGISVISIGIVYKVNLEEVTYVIPKDYHNIVLIPVLTIPLGSVIIAVAVFGCYGCITEKTSFLTVYGAILLLVFGLQVAVGISSFFQINDRCLFDRQLNDTLNDVFSNYQIYENKEIVDLIQHRLRCCGMNGPTYWTVIPRSCFETDTKNVYKEPCPALVSKYVNHCLRIVGIMSLTLSITEISGSIISLAFANYLKNNKRRYQCGKAYSVYHFGNGVI
ncbi:leukocyte surface antigen CD53-like [Anoplophora glabripennis]|uniref:leukocyte surface antigen CD53-like n=1 Tax=Anoplophora glabripennis TaxID=217634 RepID=UPI000874986B|nr:leukocyte surface antigen CD53-like [Anoplophora glabripennis]